MKNQIPILISPLIPSCKLPILFPQVAKQVVILWDGGSTNLCFAWLCKQQAQWLFVDVSSRGGSNVGAGGTRVSPTPTRPIDTSGAPLLISSS